MTIGGFDSDAVVRQTLELLGDRHLRMTPTDLVSALLERFPDLNRKSLHAAIREMVVQGALIYTHHFNSTHIELGNRGAIRISERLSLNTSTAPQTNSPSHLTLTIRSGAAFGRGDHPTTRLSLQAIDWISERSITNDKCLQEKGRALDIGTGTGVLAMAASLLGLGAAVGIDIDRVACCEAIENVRINGLVGKVFIVAGEMASLGPAPFDTIMANLRPPTLVGMIAAMAERTNRRGHWVLSGFRPEERRAVQERLPTGFHPVWSEENRNWCAIVVHNV